MVTFTEERICVGAITGVRGLKGEVRIKSFTADPADIAAYGPVTTEDGKKTFQLTVKNRSKGLVIARIEGIENRTSAENIKGERLYVQRSVLPELEIDEFYQADLIGLNVETNSGDTVGSIGAVHNFGAGNILEIIESTRNHEESMMVPFTSEIVPEVDIEGGRVVINPPVYIDATQPNKEETS